MKKTLALLLILSVPLLSGCAMVTGITKGVTSVAVAAGALDPQHADSINKSTEAVAKTFEDITPSQEYFIGRSVAALVLAQYKPLNDEKANEYLNVMGNVLSKVSDKPQTFGGYHFLVMETDEINAFAAPGGFILVSRGLINCCRNEDELAAVLAHEIAHIQHGHALQAIQKGRVTGALTILAAEGAKSFGGEQLAELTTMFEGSLNDIIGTMVNSGYSRKFETQADSSAVTILRRAGYNPSGLKNMLQAMEKNLQGTESKGFGKTHPDPSVRIKDIDPLISDCGPVANAPGREARFKQALSRIQK